MNNRILLGRYASHILILGVLALAWSALVVTDLSEWWMSPRLEGTPSKPALSSECAYADTSERDEPGETRFAKSDESNKAVERVEALLQYPELPAGCESVSLTIVLRSMGYEVPLTLIADSYLAIDPTWGDFVTAFGGDPRIGGGAMPPAIVNAANAFLDERGARAKAHDITGATFDELLAHVEAGRPVLVWTTMYMAEPAFSGREQDSYAWYTNEHCVVLYGRENGEVLVSDPLEGLVRRDAAEFQRIYEACGSLAAVIS